ncbi:TIGR04222 domain-containing membrane protein [Nocardiopsis alba]|uniref:TIGR04222 domain-containing membrane protein n=1 Tax=Nocardiopsis alba TaxID=53437 RepID=UPI00366C6C48
MDTVPFLVVSGVVVGLLLTLWPVLSLIVANLSLRRQAARMPEPVRATELDELSPLELAYLAGGSRRAGRTALMELFLRGRVRAQRRGGLITLVGPERPYVGERDPVGRAVIAVFRERAAVNAAAIVDAVAEGDVLDTVRRGLGERGLIVHSAGSERSLGRRRRSHALLEVIAKAGWVIAVLGPVFLLLLEGVSWASGQLALGLTLGVVGTVAAGFSGVSERWGGRPVPRTSAGDRLLEVAEARYPLAESRGRDVNRETALRFGAIHGMSGVRRQRRPVVADPGLMVDPGAHHSSRGEGAVGGEVFTWDEVCDYAETCADESGGGSSGSSHGGGSGDSGGFGGFGGDGGGWSFGGDSGGGDSGGGGDGGGGGGD